MTSESPSTLGVLYIRATPISRLIKVVTFTQSWQMRREGVVPSHDVSCSRIRPTCMLVTHLGGRVLHGQPPKKSQNKRQGWARQKLFPDVSIQTAKQREAYEQAREAKAT